MNEWEILAEFEELMDQYYGEEYEDE